MITPTRAYYRHATRSPGPVTSGVDKGVDLLSGRLRRRRSLKSQLYREANRAWKKAQRLESCSDEELHSMLKELQIRFRRQREESPSLRREALTLVAGICQRSMGMSPYPVQLMGALAIERGLFAEMATGEGKTLTIGLAGVLAGWRGLPCHVITANDYLAQRDAETMAPLYERCGVRVGFVIGEQEPPERVENYEKDIVYTTSQQLLADFLRDRLTMGSSFHPAERVMHQLSASGEEEATGLVLRGLHTAIVDEGDNILIDEAVTPLVISRTYANAPFRECCLLARELALSLMEGRDYEKDPARKEVRLTPRGEDIIKRQLHRLPPVWRSYDRRNELVTTALVAEHYFLENTHFAITEENKIEIIDEFTGRILPGRTWKQGLHQAVEAKCGLEITDPAETMASMSFQRFFRMFSRLSALSGTAWESADEFWHIYRLPTVRIPTHRSRKRITLNPRSFASREEKFAAIVEEARQLSDEGRPVLIGTRTLEDSERLAGQCREAGLIPAVLNAVRHQEEAEIVAGAGRAGTVTIATNMAGRGTDIPVPEEVLERGGLHVIVAEANASGRIDRQLIGRTARQGNPGSTRSYYCLEDELFQRYVPHSRQKRIAASVRTRVPGAKQLLLSAFRHARAASERAGVKQRRTVLRMDTWLEEQLSFTRPETRL